MRLLRTKRVDVYNAIGAGDRKQTTGHVERNVLHPSRLLPEMHHPGHVSGVDDLDLELITRNRDPFAVSRQCKISHRQGAAD